MPGNPMRTFNREYSIFAGMQNWPILFLQWENSCSKNNSCNFVQKVVQNFRHIPLSGGQRENQICNKIRRRFAYCSLVLWKRYESHTFKKGNPLVLSTFNIMPRSYKPNCSYLNIIRNRKYPFLNLGARSRARQVKKRPRHTVLRF